ncbi:MAG: hypothetical protein CMF61_01225 [Magnetococcales bacterium]|nr:hypothetical protein [Magnetococcales bacterium]
MKTSKPWAKPITYALTTLALLPHIICCALPVTLAIFSLIASGSVTIHHWMETPIFLWFHQYHLWVLVFAALSVFTSIILLIKKAKNNKKSKRLITFLILLLIFDISIFLFEENILGINHSATSTIHTH